MPRTNVHNTRRPQKSKGAVDLGRRSLTNADLKHIATEDLLRNGALAYEDGYADAREYGSDGRFVADWYTEEQRVKYLLGFTAGLRVHTTKMTRGFTNH